MSRYRTGEILTRSAVPTDVRVEQREVDVMAVPYDVPTDIFDSAGSYREMIAPGAFGRVGSRANEIKVLRDHHPHRVVGHCRALDHDAADGLRATLYISPTDLGNETLVLAADGVLDVSVGFMSKGGDRWNPGRTEVVRTNLDLVELSLVPFPAYKEAKVLAVRDAEAGAAARPAPTPALDEVLAWLDTWRLSSGVEQVNP